MRLGWLIAVLLALYAGFEGGRRYEARQWEEIEDCMDACTVDDDSAGACEAQCDVRSLTTRI